MAAYYEDDGASAFAESMDMVDLGFGPLRARLLGLSGNVVRGVVTLSPYHVDAGRQQFLYRVDATVGTRGHLFFRHCVSAPSPWLIVAVGFREPSDSRSVEILRRFFASTEM